MGPPTSHPWVAALNHRAHTHHSARTHTTHRSRLKSGCLCARLACAHSLLTAPHLPPVGRGAESSRTHTTVRARPACAHSLLTAPHLPPVGRGAESSRTHTTVRARPACAHSLLTAPREPSPLPPVRVIVARCPRWNLHGSRARVVTRL